MIDQVKGLKTKLHTLPYVLLNLHRDFTENGNDVEGINCSFCQRKFFLILVQKSILLVQ